MNRVYKALTIAGSDSGGGAGIQADLKTFQELGVYGMSALTAVTVQNTLGVQGVHPVPPETVAAQIASVGEDLAPDALKTGMLFSADIIEEVAGQIRRFGWRKLVVDPVMIAKGGAELLLEEAVQALRSHLLPQALVVTPNLPEAERLTGMKISGSEGKREAARRLHALGTAYVVIKGGHEEGDSERSVDLLYDGSGFTEFAGTRVSTPHTHGTGCTFSAAITAGLASGLEVTEAVGRARAFIQAALEDSLGIGHGHGPTNHWAYQRRQRPVE
ncbi:bifunctional hydroxymethylpyrimidine kinase/phosphomethylpyrimidine kinase [Paenibacillus physcomitrellae]|uniref:Hydroxymethylpyrimidine/phosphomethylpyrimidine kinase n=1 Tax=Paenibacillus physcomitrellae TaxID=1619311 RepID=A0ABQ1FRP6_9BACL|nr:bifunctional hydroxymethylpyrimidine kinase/phosphomethylpyrimidine kinase [Paenibacillus physcomitrellae]GGA27202.1 hydroxymethylpyrimidine/phosphomethylpyrimidine kinase [Paenibacillus physcomitrellae]